MACGTKTATLRLATCIAVLMKALIIKDASIIPSTHPATEAELLFMRFIAQEFGSDIENESHLISRVLPSAASACNQELLEGDFQHFCRFRFEKRALHCEKKSNQDTDDEFEPLRLLNMLYEKALEHLQHLEQAALEETLDCDDSERLAKTRAIIAYLHNTLDSQSAPKIAANLSELYEFMLDQLDLPSKGQDFVPSTVLAPLREIYEAYLEIEIRSDSIQFFQARNLS